MKNYFSLFNNKKKYYIGFTIVVLFCVIMWLFTYFFSPIPRLKAENIKAKEISITWKSSKGATIYNIYKLDQENGEYSKIATVKENKFTDYNLNPDYKYWYKVSAIINGEEGKLSSSIGVYTKKLPGSPTNLVIESYTFDNVKIKWGPVNNIDKYIIYRKDEDKGDFKKVGESKDSTYLDTKLKSTSKYNYKITAVDKNGEGNFSEAIEVITREKVNEMGNSGNNIENDGYAAEQGEWIYFVNKSAGFNSLYKVRKDGTSLKKLFDGSIQDINVVDNRIYFLNFSSGFSVCKINTDGSGYKEIITGLLYGFTIKGNWLYYDDKGINKINLMSLKTEKLTNVPAGSINIEDDWIYYSNISDKNRIYKIKTDGSNNTKLTDKRTSKIIIYEDWIYFTDLGDKNSPLYRMKKDGSDCIKVIDYGVTSFNIGKDTLIYNLRIGNSQMVFKSDIDGKKQSKVTDIYYSSINIIDNYAFIYGNASERVEVIKIKDDLEDKSFDIGEM
ncbi:DUF5050 domain-containing protein [Candidatus Clostridium stratigraminis]|uniref:DUF5050 domain-containing protein n=1 Tax=Candidatus Clostridium stratigraminis TaxID=3381661 RepID=A0ABW8T7A2_9CLOT